MRSTAGSKTSANAIDISTAPKDEARWPPFLETVSIILERSSAAVI
jgi:hypothetical protein